MKERIVIEKEVLCKLLDWVSMQVRVYTDEDLKKERKIVLFGKEYKTEKEPTNWEDLKELCKELKDVDIEGADEIDVARIIIHNADLIYFEDEILMIAGFKKLEIKPEQMWQIIKGLIGE